MAVFQLGPIIRNRRTELGLSQEDLADGICSVPTLSRIENGERMPTKNHFEMLMQRLGCNLRSPTATGAVVNGHSAVRQRPA